MSANGIFIFPRTASDRAIQRIAACVNAYPNNKKIKVTISEAKPERSDAQNRALWGCAYKAIAEATGHDKEDLHEFFCGEYFGWKTIEMFGKMRRRPIRTTTMNESGEREVINTQELSDFYSFVQMRMAEFGIDVPDPDPEWFENVPRRKAAESNSQSSMHAQPAGM